MRTKRRAAGCVFFAFCWLSQYRSQVRYQHTRPLILSRSSLNSTSLSSRLRAFTHVSINFSHLVLSAFILFLSQREGGVAHSGHRVELSAKREIVLADFDWWGGGSRLCGWLQPPRGWWWCPLADEDVKRDSLPSSRATSSLDGAFATYTSWYIVKKKGRMNMTRNAR